MADEWAKLAPRCAGRPWSGLVQLLEPTRPSQEESRPLPRSLANVKRGFLENKWTDAKNWVKKKRLSKSSSCK